MKTSMAQEIKEKTLMKKGLAPQISFPIGIVFRVPNVLCLFSFLAVQLIVLELRHSDSGGLASQLDITQARLIVDKTRLFGHHFYSAKDRAFGTFALIDIIQRNMLTCHKNS
jgi:hypothetical protein